jgi:hypothetical protein
MNDFLKPKRENHDHEEESAGDEQSFTSLFAEVPCVEESDNKWVLQNFTYQFMEIALEKVIEIEDKPVKKVESIAISLGRVTSCDA